MLQVCIPVHPITRAALCCYYGAEPLVLDNNHDVLFSHLAGHVVRHSGRGYAHLTARVTFAVHDDLAEHLRRYSFEIGARLFLWHKMQICLFALAHYRAQGKGSIRGAISDWLALHSVDEDDYSVEAGYKLFQRFFWELEKKNPRFSGRARGKPSTVLPKKKQHRANLARPVQPLTLRASEVEPELATARFMSSARMTFRRLPSRLERQVRTYMYKHALELTERDVAQKLRILNSTAHYHIDAVRRRAAANPAFARILAESLALPQPA